MKTLMFILFSLPLIGQVSIVQWESDGIFYQDAFLDDKLYFKGEIKNLKCVSCDWKIMTNRRTIVEMDKTIVSNDYIQFSKDSKTTYYNILGQRILRPAAPGWYIVKRGNLSYEKFINSNNLNVIINGI